jgi:hypothetical protein
MDFLQNRYKEEEKMSDLSTLKLLGELFYLLVALSALYGIWDLVRGYRTTNSTVIRTHIIAYELRKMIEARSRQA